MNASRAVLLVVEDNPGVADTLGRMLTRHGFEVVVAVDGASALREASKRAPDVLLVDYLLPDMSGALLARELRRRASRRLPVICLTGLDIDDREHFDLVISKPPESMAVLARQIREVMQ